MEEKLVIGGIYRHYKGGAYRVLGLAENAGNKSDGETIVYYKSIRYGSYYTRPYDEFVGNEYLNGELVKRFTLNPYAAI
jgi:hypothetical protein